MWLTSKRVLLRWFPMLLTSTYSHFSVSNSCWKKLRLHNFIFQNLSLKQRVFLLHFWKMNSIKIQKVGNTVTSLLMATFSKVVVVAWWTFAKLSHSKSAKVAFFFVQELHYYWHLVLRHCFITVMQVLYVHLLYILVTP